VATGAAGTTATPGTPSLALTTYAPAVPTPRLCTPPVASISLAAYAPAAVAPRLCTPAAASIALAAYAPSVRTSQAIGPGPPVIDRLSWPMRRDAADWSERDRLSWVVPPDDVRFY
jgi:hypothetical protein